MTTTKVPFADRYACPLFSKTVALKGLIVTLHGDGLAAVASERSNMNCSGSPMCGQMLGQPPCPYAAK